MARKTMFYFKNFVIMENFVAISRPYLIEDKTTRLICTIISFSIMVLIASIAIFDLITVELSVGIRLFQIIVGVEFFGLASVSRFRKAIFHIIEKLDEKCGDIEEFGSIILSRSTNILISFIPSMILDFLGLKFIGANYIYSIFLTIAFAAHDAEMYFFSMLVETINMRVERLKSVSPSTGSRVYRHVLIAIAHLSEQYTARLLLLLGITLITTVAYESVLTLTDSGEVVNLALYFIWRETRALHSLWTMCSAVARTSNVCSELALHLAGRLTQDQCISKQANPVQHKALHRLYSMVMWQRPQYISGSTLSVSLSTPLILFDLSINYMLIFVQMYLAYK